MCSLLYPLTLILYVFKIARSLLCVRKDRLFLIKMYFQAFNPLVTDWFLMYNFSLSLLQLAFLWPHFAKAFTLFCLPLRLQEDNMGKKKIWKKVSFLSWNPSIYNILRWVAWTMGQTNCRPRVWTSKYFFFIISYRLRALKTLYFHFCNFLKK